MAITYGKLEARIRVPTGGAVLQLADAGGGPWTVTLDAGDYYHSTDTFAAHLKSKLDASPSTGTYTVSVSAAEAGTGKYTISVSGVGNYSITWTDTWVRDLLGFAGNITTATTSTGTLHAEGLWRSPCVPDSFYRGTDKGADMTDAAVIRAGNGVLRGFISSAWIEQSLIYAAVPAARARVADEATVNESWQAFWRAVASNPKTWASVGGPVRWYPDAGSASYHEYRMLTLDTCRPMRVRPGWSGLYSIEVPLVGTGV